MPHILAELTPLDPATGSRTTIRLASANDRRITNLDAKRWWPAIIKRPTLSWDAFDGAFGGEVDIGSASLEIALHGLGRADSDAPAYNWAASSVVLWAGEIGDAWANWTQVFVGIVDGFEIGASKLRLTAKVDIEPFQASVLTDEYAGTGGAEGGVDMKGRKKPLALGYCLNIDLSNYLVDAVNNVFQVSGYGPINAVSAVYERGASFGASVGNYASYATLVAATIPNGRFATCLAEGLIRLGAPPAGLITADVEGDNTGGFSRTGAAVIQRAATIAGVSSALLDTASFSAFETACPEQINRFVTEDISVLEFARDRARPFNAFCGVSLLGKLIVSRFSAIPASPAIALDAKGRRLPAVRSVTEQDVSPPFARIEFQAERNWRPMALSDLAFEAPLKELGDYSAGTTYREGNIVFQPTDGATYLYINATPSAGHAPPNATYWAKIRSADPAIAAAATSANTAISRLDDIDDDGILSISDKIKILIPENARLEAAWAILDGQAATLGVTTERTAAASARTAWQTYRDGLSPGWSDTGAATAVDRATYDSKLSDYSTALKDLEKALTAKVKAAADAAQSAATAAQTDASSALTKIGNIVSDSVLDKSEKPDIVQRYTAITNEQAGIDAQATSYSITTEKTAYDTAVSALTTYLTGLSPAYTDYTTDTTIVRSTFNTKFTNLYSARQALLNKIAEVAGTVAEWDNVSNSPRDGTNLFRRPKPEGGNLDGWLLGSTWSASNTPARGWVLKVTGLAAISDAVGTDWVAVQPGDVFHAEWETYKGADGANGTLNLYADVGGLTQVAGSFDAILSVNSSSETASVWTGKRTATWTVPAGCYWARFRLSSRAEHTTGTWWINAPKVASYAPGADVTSDGYAAGVQDGAVVLQTGGVGVLLGLQMLAQTVSDGTVVTFSPAFARRPEVEFDIASLPALASGESYSVRAESLTASGFTARVKKRTSGGTPVSLSTGLGTAVVAGEDYQVSKGDSRDARDGIYNFRVKGELIAVHFTAPPEHTEGYITLEFWAKVSGTWQSLGQSTVVATGVVTETKTFDKTFAMTCAAAIGEAAGNEFRVTVAARYGLDSTDKITELTSVSWQADGTAVTETSVSQSVIAKVRPVNA